MDSPPSDTMLRPVKSSSCTNCYSRLLELKKQAMKSMMVEYQKIIVGSRVPSLENLLLAVYQNLILTEQHSTDLLNNNCTYCGVNVEWLKKHALLALQTANFAPFVTTSMMTINQEHQGFNDAFVGARPTASHGETTDTVNGHRVQGLNNTSDYTREIMISQKDPAFPRLDQLPNGGSLPTPTPAQFFAEAAKKFNIPSKRRSKRANKVRVEDNRLFPTDFSSLIKKTPPPNPPGLFRYMGRRVDGKVSVMLRISSTNESEHSDSLIEVDQRRKQISVLQPKNMNYIPPKLQSINSGPKLYGFDAIFEPELLPSRVSSGALLDVLHAVVNGGEGCLLVYGASGVGKTTSMVGRDESNNTLGFIPAAIAWLYSLLEDCKQRTGARISVRVSAVEVIGQSELLKDLLSEQAGGGDSMDSTGASPGIYLREDPIGGTVQLGNVSEPQAVSAEKAAFYLDAALAARKTDKETNSHMIFTIHVYQYRVEKNQRRGPGGAVPYSGGRSRLHLIDLSCFNSNFNLMQNGLAPSHAGLGQIIVAMLNGFKQVPYKDSKITRLLKDSIGNPTCRTTLVAHVSTEEKNYAKTFSTLQTISKIQRSRRKRNKYCSSSSDNNTSCDEGRRRRPNPAIVKTYGIDDNNMSSDCTSSAGEDSCDTVIYMGNNGQTSDRDLSDNERPPSPKTFRAMKLKLASSSEDETSESTNSTTNFPLKSDELCTSTKSKKEEFGKDMKNESDAEYHKPRKEFSDTGDIVNNPNALICPNVDSESRVSIVTPLASSDKPYNSPCLDPSTDSKKSLIDEFIENGSKSDILLAPTNDNNGSDSKKIPSEKELRRREKRISKLLKESLSDGISSLDSEMNDKDMVCTSDGDSKYISAAHKKLDGYLSAPENNRFKPIQAVKGIIRQFSAESSCERQCIKSEIDPFYKEEISCHSIEQQPVATEIICNEQAIKPELKNIDLRSIEAEVNSSKQMLKTWVQREFLKHLHEMETIRNNLGNTSDDISSKVFSKEDVTNELDMSVECCESLENNITSNTDNLNTPFGSISNILNCDSFPFDGVGTPVDVIDSLHTRSPKSLSVNDSSDVVSDITISPINSSVLYVGPNVHEDSLPSSSHNEILILSDSASTEVLCDDILLGGSVESNALYQTSSTSVETNTDGYTYSTPVASVHENRNEKRGVSRNNNISLVENIDNDLEDSPKIRNLDHVITVSTIPNFTVANNKTLLNQFISSPQIQRQASRTASIAAVKYYKGSTTSVDLQCSSKPTFERSYSKDDTISLVSVNDSEMYDSDNYCSSLTRSPVVDRKQRAGPARLRYRWSTVFEEEEKKKEKNTKTPAYGRSEKITINVKNVENNSNKIPSAPISTRLSRSKKEKERNSKTVSPQSPFTSPKWSNPSPRASKKFHLLSPRSDRRIKENSSDKRNSGCSDASSGIGSSSSHSQSSSLHSNDGIIADDVTIEKESTTKSKYWPFTRNKSRKYRSSSGYASDGNITDATARSNRRSGFFGVRSKSMTYNDGHSSGYDTSITEEGMTSCNDDLTDAESARRKKRRRFLGFRRRSTNDLNSSRGRYKKPIWLDNRRCQSDDEGVRIKVYEIDEPRQSDHQRCKSETSMSPHVHSNRSEESRKGRRSRFQSEHPPLGSDKFQSLLSTAPDLPIPICTKPNASCEHRGRSNSKGDDHYSMHLEKENSALGKKLKTLKNHIQVVTCFDIQSNGRKVTRI